MPDFMMLNVFREREWYSAIVRSQAGWMEYQAFLNSLSLLYVPLDQGEPETYPVRVESQVAYFGTSEEGAPCIGFTHLCKGLVRDDVQVLNE